MTDPTQPDWMRCPHGACQVKEACDSPDVCAVAESSAQPVEATPETDALLDPPGTENSITELCAKYNTLLAHARHLERHLSLAQTENAGHIRIEDELKAELLEVRALMQPGQIDAVMEGIRRRDEQLAKAYVELKIQDDANEILQRRLDEALARCASDMVPVPREPTTEMLEAMGAHDGYVPRDKEVFPYQRYHDYYTAMLAASPKPSSR